MERISRFRAIILLAIFILILVLFAGRLFVLQIIETDGNTDNTATYSTITTIRAARGDILDRNGNVLVGNRASYDLVFNHYVIKSSPGTNEYLYRLVEKCADLNVIAPLMILSGEKAQTRGRRTQRRAVDLARGICLASGRVWPACRGSLKMRLLLL